MGTDAIGAKPAIGEAYKGAWHSSSTAACGQTLQQINHMDDMSLSEVLTPRSDRTLAVPGRDLS
jgi:hypothetical protein